MTRPLLIILGLLLLGCEPGSPTPPGELEAFAARRTALADTLSRCERSSTTRSGALAAQARCVVLQVPENPAQPQGRQIPLRVMQIPAIRQQPEPDPLFILVGGPGQAATEAGLPLAQILFRVRQARDVILVDQRGTGRLSPLDCALPEQELELEASLMLLLERQQAALRNCLASLEADPAFYTTDMAVRDLEAVRAYFAYPRINLWGGSYGSRVGLAYLQAYPARTRALVIDGVAPASLRIPLNVARDASRVFDRVLDLCAARSACAAAFPALRQQYQEVLERLSSPQTVMVRDWAANSDSQVELHRDLFVPAMRALLYSRETIRLLPLMIEQAHRGNYQPLLSLAMDGHINQAMYLSVICNEDMSRISEQELDAALDNSALPLASDLFIRPLREACRIWPSRSLDADYFAPVVSDRPVLILSGALDPATPPVWGEQVAGHLSNARHLRAEGVAHIITPYGCVPQLIAQFIETADPQGLDATCLEELQVRPFFLNPSGSEALDD